MNHHICKTLSQLCWEQIKIRWFISWHLYIHYDEFKWHKKTATNRNIQFWHNVMSCHVIIISSWYVCSVITLEWNILLYVNIKIVNIIQCQPTCNDYTIYYVNSAVCIHYIRLCRYNKYFDTLFYNTEWVNNL